MIKDVTIAMHFDECYASTKRAKDPGVSSEKNRRKEKTVRKNYRDGTLPGSFRGKPALHSTSEPKFNISQNEVGMSDEMRT